MQVLTGNVVEILGLRVGYGASASCYLYDLSIDLSKP